MKNCIDMKNLILAIALLIPAALTAQSVRFHNEAADTLTINRLLSKAAAISDPGARVEAIAREFLDTPYVGGTLESADGSEALTVNLDELDCTTFAETVMALCITAAEGRSAWQDFLYNLRNIRYRGGNIDGYPSRLHYISEWVVDNVHRGNFDEVTNQSASVSYEVKTLDFMSTNRDRYPALADSANFARVKSNEIGYRSHRFPFIKERAAAKAAKEFLRPGDIIAFTTSVKGLDVSHMAILVNEKGRLAILDASSRSGKVMIEPYDLAEYLRRNRSLTGFRVFRLKQD